MPPRRTHYFQLRKSHVYMDKKLPVLEQNRLVKLADLRPHFVLMDEKKQDRFVLGHSKNDDGHIVIHNIQRERTPDSYIKTGSQWAWHFFKEKKASREFQKKLGMFPGDFLLEEFIRRNKKHLNSGKKIYLEIEKPESSWNENQKNANRNYRGYINKYFKRQRFDNGTSWLQELSIDKNRVKKLIGKK